MAVIVGTIAMQRDADVIIVGGAIAGGSLANALGQLGVRTIVFEKGARRDTSTRGDVLHPPSLRFLHQWGVLSTLHADGTVPIKWLAVSHRDLGRVATYPIPAQDDGPAGRTIAAPHDRIEAILRACASRWPSVMLERATVNGLARDNAGRVCGVRIPGAEGEVVARAALVVGCDGGASVTRRDAGIDAPYDPYPHDLLYIAAEGPTDPPEAMHYHLADRVFMVASRPRGRMRIAIRVERGEQLSRSARILHEFVASRVPALAPVRFSSDDIHVYPLGRLLADRFYAPGLALVGDAAHTTHPAGSTGMSLAIAGAARLVDQIGPILVDGVSTPAQTQRLDSALARYDAERRPAAAAAIEANHVKALQLWGRDVHNTPHEHARAVNPLSGWGASGGTWGRDPAGLEHNAGTPLEVEHQA